MQNYYECQNFEDIDELMDCIGHNASVASNHLSTISAKKKNKALNKISKVLRSNKREILSENKRDLDNGEKKQLSPSLLDRLALDSKRVDLMADGVDRISEFDDPVGQIIASWKRPNGLVIERVRMPLGVIGVIYESRPNVTIDAGALCLKAGNACILRGGSESFFSTKAILACVHEALSSSDIPVHSIQMVSTTDRAAVTKMLNMTQYIDVIVPRGGASLTKKVMMDSKIPTFQHLIGLCHTYIHKEADPKKAQDVVFNAKMRRPGICGATETVLVDKEVTKTFLPKIIDELVLAGCEVRGDKEIKKLGLKINLASDEDWETEYLDKIISIKTVENIDDAIGHIQKYGSEHTDAIITENYLEAEKFMNSLPSSIVMHNASTQFADGAEFGMGAEIGIATGKMHARGPVGIEQLTTFKYKVRGDGTIRP
ncbi:MAG: glutamate-5-semialdehyde dehydrogenase [Pseudomonadota bacterium]|nr:glutamate-5-semialdehyde dehydrogenase [Pseudomonadota bacterium]